MPQRLTIDASPVGVGAILEQKQEDGTYRSIYYASQKLSKVEARYSQLERETLAVRWACERFYLYLYGIKFEICTDHKPPVTALICPDRKVASVLIAIPGKANAADVLSRLPIGSTQGDFAYSVASAAVLAALLPKQVETATAKDPTL